MLTLHGVKKISEIAADSLSKIKGDLHMAGLTEIHDAPAYISLIQKLSSNVNGELVLENLSEITDQAANYISTIEGDLDIYLEGLTKISDEAAQSLAKIDRDNITLPAEIEQIVERYRADDDEEEEDDEWEDEDEEDWDEEE